MAVRVVKAFLAIGAVFLLAGCWALMQPQLYEPGEKVAAKWSTMWYEATVIGRDGDAYVVKYSDNTIGNVQPAEMRHLLARRDLRVGQHVIAVWRTSTWYPGTVQSLADDGAMIKWDDGGTPSVAPYGKIAAFETP